MQHGHDMSTLFGQDFSILQGLKVNKIFLYKVNSARSDL